MGLSALSTVLQDRQERSRPFISALTAAACSAVSRSVATSCAKGLRPLGNPKQQNGALCSPHFDCCLCIQILPQRCIYYIFTSGAILFSALFNGILALILRCIQMLFHIGTGSEQTHSKQQYGTFFFSFMHFGLLSKQGVRLRDNLIGNYSLMNILIRLCITSAVSCSVLTPWK